LWEQSGKTATLSRKPYSNFALSLTINFISMGYLRRPTIFEIATAFENGQEGEIMAAQEDGYIKTYRSLSNDEKRFAYRHPKLAYEFNNNADKASKKCRRTFSKQRRWIW
jgi:hypothetical protein